jgi:penicillin-binding protein 2
MRPIGLHPQPKSKPKRRPIRFQRVNTLKDKQKLVEREVGQKLQPFLIMFLISLALLGGVGSRLAYLQLYQGAFLIIPVLIKVCEVPVGMESVRFKRNFK